MPGTTVRSKIRLAKATKKITEEIKADDGFSIPASAAVMRCNPLGELIDDETYAILQQYRLLDRKSLRDYQIRKSYREMREQMSAGQALEQLHSLHPYLEFDTIRKIVYQMTPKVS
jgi:hypothetical protein